MILSRQDLSDPENVKNCIREIREIMDDIIGMRDDMSVSAHASDFFNNWGEAIIAGFNQSQDDESDAIADLKKEIGEIKDAHKAHLNEIQDAHVEAEAALLDLGKAIEQ